MEEKAQFEMGQLAIHDSWRFFAVLPFPWVFHFTSQLAMGK
jgi:hypothetical protein